jgi:septum formation protein
MRRLSSFKLVLASRSPQRRAILTHLGVPFRVAVSDHPEQIVAGQPHGSAEANARGKARAVLGRERLAAGELVLGVDTVVVIDGAILGKAADADEARACLSLLSGRTHEVVSGLCVCDGESEFCAHAVTSVTFAPLDPPAIDRYLATEEWRERAGAYAIQGYGSALVAAVDGDYFNVVGLPVALLTEALTAFGVARFAWLGESGC